MMRIVFILFLFCNLVVFGQNEEYERIVFFYSDIRVQPSSDVLIHETIKVYAEGNDIKRGIFRDLPLSYAYKGGNVTVGFELLSVKRDGRPEPYHTEWIENGVRIYAGDEDVFLNTGYYTYSIEYKVNHVLGYFKEFDEIYWNVNGNGWAFQIDSVSATVYLPKGAKMKRLDAYTGQFGEKGKDFSVQQQEDKILFSTTRPFSYYENMTVAVAWNKGLINYPTPWENFLFWLKTYILWVLAILGLLTGFVYNFISWFRFGRDPKPGTIIPRFYAPEGFSPAECAYLKNCGRETKTMFGAQLVSLAVKGYINISVKEKKGMFDENIYTITRNSEDQQKQELLPLEVEFFNTLMGSKDLLIITEKYNAKVKLAYDKLNENIGAEQDSKFIQRNAHLKAKQFILPFVFGAIGVLAYSFYGGLIIVTIAAFFLHVVMNMIYAGLYEQPTALGRQKMDEIAGFEMYMKYADKLRIKAINPPTMDFEYFEKNLAYAIALGVAEEWKGQFDVQIIEQGSANHMPYLTGMSLGHIAAFSSQMSSTISSASTPPGSSSGSGGGGSSGGGGGGGGGGGW
jgi:uncharacterized membrane protein YgcG